MFHSLLTVVLVWFGASVPVSLAVAQLIADKRRLELAPVAARSVSTRRAR